MKNNEYIAEFTLEIRVWGEPESTVTLPECCIYRVLEAKNLKDAHRLAKKWIEKLVAHIAGPGVFMTTHSVTVVKPMKGGAA